jgi:hypothetical protein
MCISCSVPFNSARNRCWTSADSTWFEYKMAEDPGLLYESGERRLLFGLSHHVGRRADHVAEFVMRQTHAFLVLWEVGLVWMVQD